MNAEDGDAFQQLLLWVQDEIQQEKCPVRLWGSLPYTIECRAASLDLVTKFHSLAELVQCFRGGSVSFEWSHHSEGWNEPKVQNCMSSLGLQAVHMDACAFGFISDEKHFQRKWTIQTDNPRLIRKDHRQAGLAQYHYGRLHYHHTFSWGHHGHGSYDASTSFQN